MALRLLTALPTAATVAAAAVDAYLVALVAAAARDRHAPTASARPAGRLAFAVLVPARDERTAIGETLASLARVDYPPGLVEVIVVADNCTDGTEDVAAAAGVTVWRREGGDDGKGAALAWALDELLPRRPAPDAVAFVDADCTVTPNLLTAMEARLLAGAAAVQVANRVANPAASWTAGLRYASFALANGARPRGKAALGLSAGLFGTGMAFSRGLLARHRWPARSLLEDQEFHLSLVAAGERVAFAPEASVLSAMPTSLRRSSSQQLRWDAGRAGLIRAWTPRLLAAGVRRRDAAQVHAALEAFIPPQSLLLAANCACGLLALPASGRVRALAATNMAAQAASIAGALALDGAPAAAWRALAFAPAHAGWKLGLLVRQWLGRGPTAWVRTAREPAAAQLPAARARPDKRRAMRRRWSSRTNARSSGSARGSRRTPAAAHPAA